MFFGVLLGDVLRPLLESADRLVGGLVGHHIVVGVVFLYGDVLSPLFRHVVSVALLHRLVLVVHCALGLGTTIGVPDGGMVAVVAVVTVVGVVAVGVHVGVGQSVVGVGVAETSGVVVVGVVDALFALFVGRSSSGSFLRHLLMINIIQDSNGIVVVTYT